MEISGSVPIHPTEDPAKVRQGVERLFPASVIEADAEVISFRSEDADEFSMLLSEQRIRDTAVMVLQRELKDDSTRFFLNKQAAFMGKVNFTEGSSSLGDISVRVLSGAACLIAAITPE